MTHDELLTRLSVPIILKAGTQASDIVNIDLLMKGRQALLAVVESHKPFAANDSPHEVAIGWCKGCSIGYEFRKYAGQKYPCPTIQAIEKELE